MCNSLVSRSIVIRNPQGLHARPAQLLAQLATTYEARIELIRDAQRVDAKSILNLLTLAATQGTVLTLEVQGKDAAEAAEQISKLVDSGFGVDEPCDSAGPAD
jgi:phosphocarrier protein HPr